MYWWQYLLFPFGVLFDLITRIRNYLYDTGFQRSFRFHTNVIAVGNLSVGGTGKTPMVNFLIDYFLQRKIKVATLSRGYRRKTNGFRLANEHDTPQTLGDEPFMYYCRYRPHVQVAVGEERDLAIPEILYHLPDTEVILLDDAFQHRIVSPSLNILLTTWHRPFYKDYLMPAGHLREARRGAKRAEIIVVTKCPAVLTDADQIKIREKIGRYSQARVFFTTIAYDLPKPVFENDGGLKGQVVGISGIADPAGFNTYLSKTYRCKLIHNYRDHHHYSKKDIMDITNELGNDISLMTTEKDMVKLRSFAALESYSCY